MSPGVNPMSTRCVSTSVFDRLPLPSLSILAKCWLCIVEAGSSALVNWPSWFLSNCANDLMSWPPSEGGFANAIGVTEIGRAHGCTPGTNAELVCRLLLEQEEHGRH